MVELYGHHCVLYAGKAPEPIFPAPRQLVIENRLDGKQVCVDLAFRGERQP